APRGQLKSSARPFGAGTGSPLVRTRVTVASTLEGRCAPRPPPTNSSVATLPAVSGTTRPATRPCGRAPRLAFFCRPPADRNRQRHRQAPVGDAAIDLALDVVGKLAGAELGEIDAVIGAQAADLAFIVQPLRRVAPGLVDEAVPDIDIDDAGLLRPAAVNL